MFEEVGGSDDVTATSSTCFDSLLTIFELESEGLLQHNVGRGLLPPLLPTPLIKPCLVEPPSAYKQHTDIKQHVYHFFFTIHAICFLFPFASFSQSSFHFIHLSFPAPSLFFNISLFLYRSTPPSLLIFTHSQL